jgi:2-polyprenyl-3-methyl-5-hydroxy-6-metoxy-1,4-benzoquinol methylase
MTTTANFLQAKCIVCSTEMRPYIDSISDDRYGCPGVFSITQCERCGYMATMPPLKDSDLPCLYSHYYPRREVNFHSIESEAHKVLAPQAKLWRWLSGTDNQGHYCAKPGQKVLDIGSGSCLALLELRAMGVQAWGVEADPNVRAIAEHFQLQVHIGSIQDAPFSDLLFDLIVLNQVIEHVPDPLALLRALKTRLNPNDGMVILSFPNTDSLVAARSKERWINWHVPFHQHHFNRKSFEKLAKQAGFSVKSSRTITPNLWSLLQLRANRELPSEGRASATWVSTTDTAIRPFFTGKLKRKLTSLAVRIMTPISIIFNRAVDAAGKGDSLLIELRATTTR